MEQNPSKNSSNLEFQLEMQKQQHDKELSDQLNEFKKQLEMQKTQYEQNMSNKTRELLMQLDKQKEKYESEIANKTFELQLEIEKQKQYYELELTKKAQELIELRVKNNDQQIKIKKLQDENQSLNKKCQSRPYEQYSPKNIDFKIFDENDIEDFEKIEVIGSGGGGKVYKILKKELYALKEMNSDKNTIVDFQHFIGEYEIMNMLKHPNVLKAFGIFMSSAKNPACILLEFCPMNLETAIKNKILNKEKIILVIYQIVEGMKFIHFRKIIHRDLKPTNILIAFDGSIKICDFGISKLMSLEEQTMTRGVGTQRFMAPEIINDDQYDEKVDVYSFGSLIFFILSGEFPKIKISDIFQKKKAPIPSSFTSFSQDLINDCWNFDSKDRPSFKEILERMEQNHFQLLELTSSEIKNVESFVSQHKLKIPQYDE